jgi:inosine-uridine nucleoside N-ribohydrolase
MHDPLAVATFIDRTLVHLREYYVAVETQGQLTAGETLGYDRAPIRQSAPLANSSAASDVGRSIFVRNAKVAVEVDASRFFQLLIGRVAGRG